MLSLQFMCINQSKDYAWVFVYTPQHYNLDIVLLTILTIVVILHKS